MILTLSGCLGPAKFDASNKTTIEESSKLIVAKMPENEREDYQKAFMYFSIGGSEGFKSMMKKAFNEEASEKDFLENLKVLNGLTGPEIIAKHKVMLEEERKKEEQLKVERAQIKTLESEAKALLSKNKFLEAIDKYNALSEIPAAKLEAEKEIEKTRQAMEEFTVKMNYIDKIEITEFTAKRIDTYLKKDVPAVRVSLKNNGDRSLDEVKVIVYFQDKNDTTIYEKAYHPVLASSWTDKPPLKAGYVKEMAKDKYYTLDVPLTDWEEGKATIKVADIEFTDSKNAQI
jgi:hypothetical protein